MKVLLNGLLGLTPYLETKRPFLNQMRTRPLGLTSPAGQLSLPLIVTLRPRIRVALAVSVVAERGICDGDTFLTFSEVAAERFFSSLGLRTEWVADAPGRVLVRFVAQLVNEACFALGEGVGHAADVDAGLVLGMNHPRGPLEWADHHGAAEMLAVLEGLQREYGEERYRPAPALLRAARAGELLSEPEP